MGLTRADLVVAGETIGLPRAAALLADAGITTVQLAWITDWWTTGAQCAASDAVRRDLFEACPVLSVDNVKVGADDDGTSVCYGQLCDGLAALGTEAAEVGVRIGFENTPFSHLAKTTDQAIAFVHDVDHPNAGLILDIWHTYRGGTDYARLPELLRLDQVLGVALDDGPAEALRRDLVDTFDRRLVCGTGDFVVRAFVAAVRAIGWTGPRGIEHMSEDYGTLPIEQALSQARDDALTCLG
jgi:sugar phosphate isomerase/epimerase